MVRVRLKFRKTNVSTHTFTFPGCETPRNRLRDAKKFERIKAFFIKKIYIPKRARLCLFHSSEESWNVDMDMDEFMTFSPEQLQDLIELATASTDFLKGKKPYLIISKFNSFLLFFSPH